MLDRSPTSIVQGKSNRILTREYALICRGRIVAQARGEHEFHDEGEIVTSAEACKSNALMRCCKDLGIASELWDPDWIVRFREKFCHQAWVTHQEKKSKSRLWRLKRRKFDYPWIEQSTYV